MKHLLLTAALLLAAPAIFAQGTPDGETPANEGVCDELMYATPGLYGLCVAFCEAQDCSPDWEAEDPFNLCNPSNPRILEVYRRKMQPDDIDMPCVKAPPPPAPPTCPCFTAEEVSELTSYPFFNCSFNYLRLFDDHYYETSHYTSRSDPSDYVSTAYTTAYYDLSQSYTVGTCGFQFVYADGSHIVRFQRLDQEQVMESCEKIILDFIKSLGGPAELGCTGTF